MDKIQLYESNEHKGIWCDREGNIYSTKRNYKGGIKRLSLCADRKGYLYFHTKTNGVGKNIKAHRIVSECFLGKRENGMQVNHKDGNKQNNCYDNLEYCTASENILHSFNVLGHKVPSSAINSIKKWRENGGVYNWKRGFDNKLCKNIVVNGKTYPNAKEAAKDIGVSDRLIRMIANGRLFKRGKGKAITSYYKQKND